jgi:methylase of polypeptide subunit release factors
MIVKREASAHPEQPTAPEANDRLYLFGPVVVRIRQRQGVWELTPHGQALGDGMTLAQHALAGKAVVEIGAGTGVHAIAALKLGARHVDVTDIDPAALELAVENAILNQVSYRHVWERDWLNFEPDEGYDTLLCNPPFCKAGTPDRRFFIRQLISQGPRIVRPGGHLLFVQSSMADFSRTEQELGEAGWYFTRVHEARHLFRDYYFREPGFVEQSRRVPSGFEEIDGAFVETLRVYWCTRT